MRHRQYRNSPLANKSFSVSAAAYPYFLHPYNRTWNNERAVEIPIVLEHLRKVEPQGVLEVGNVLSHYYDVQHTVVDKWEKGDGVRVINEDILDYKPNRTFDFIVSISTVEHIGWDEKPQCPERVLEAFPKLQSLLRPQGKALLTIPIGYNRFLDKCLHEKQVPFSEAFFMIRKNAANEWAECDAATALEQEYARPFPAANALAVLIMGGQDERSKPSA